MTNVLNYFFLFCTILQNFSSLKIHDNDEISNVFPISIPSEFYKILVTQNNLFVDKTMFIFDLIEHSRYTEFILRPPKWGKTFNLEMTRLFFDIQYDEKGNPQPWKNRSIYFKGGALEYETGEKYYKTINLQPLEISKHTNAMQHMGAHPVIFLSFEGFGGSYNNFLESTIQAISSIIISKKYAFLTTYCDKLDLNDISEEECKQLLRSPYEALRVDRILEHSFYILSALLKAHSQQNVTILIDEYDYPLRDIMMNSNTDYSSVKEFQYKFFSNTFKKGECFLYKGIITGIFRDVESPVIRSDINNAQYYTIVDDKYSSYFGFTEHEIEELLKKGKYKATIGDIKSWHNGYYTGKNKMHNPYSVQRCLSAGGTYKSHWVNVDPSQLQCTNTPEVKFLVRSLLADNRQYLLQELYCGHTCFTSITNHIDFRLKLFNGQFLSILTFLGYLTARRLEENDVKNTYEVMIPNQEIRDFISLFFQQWISSKNKAKQAGEIQTLNDVTTCLAKGNDRAIEKILNEILPKMSISENTHCEIIFSLLLYSSIPWKLNRSFSDKEIPWDCVITLTPKKITDPFSPIFITVGRKHTTHEIWKRTLMEVPQKNDRSILKTFLTNAAKNISIEYITNHTSSFITKLFECSPSLSIHQPSPKTKTEGSILSQQVFTDVYIFNGKSERKRNQTSTMTTMKIVKTIIDMNKQKSRTPMTFVKTTANQQNSKPKSVLVGPPFKQQSWKRKLKNVLKRAKAKILKKTSPQPRPIGEEQSKISTEALFSSSKEQSKSASDELFLA